MIQVLYESFNNYISKVGFYYIIKHAGIAFTVLTVGVTAIIYKFQNSLIYQPHFPNNSTRNMDEPSKYNLPFDDVVIRTSDNLRLGAYLVKRETEEETKKADTIILFHANAGNMGHRLPLVQVLHRVLNCNVLMLSYRGYGYSDGEPSEAGIKLDSEAALNYVANHELTKNGKIILYGQSIGGAVAIDLASRFENKIYAIILENTFLTLPKLIFKIIPMTSYVPFVIHQKWNSEVAIRKLTKVPVLFLSGASDSLIPPSHMDKLYELLSDGSPKVMKKFPNGDHNNTVLQDGYFQAIEEFWNTYVLSK